MYYPGYTKAIIYHFITKDKSISIRNKMFMHTTEDDSILSLMIFVSKSEDFQVYGALLLDVMTNQKMQNSRAYKTYLAYATRVTTLKKARKFKKPASPSKKRTLVIVEEEEPEPDKKIKAPVTEKRKGINLLPEDALLEEAKLKKVLNRSQPEKTIHQAGGSGEGTSYKPGVLDEPKGKSIDTHKGTGDSGDEANVQGDDEDVLENYVPTDETNDESNDVDEKEYDRIDKELYGDVNIRLKDVEQDDEGREDAYMTDAAHVRVE
nr:hypothetical protein [Tanacetum cinerariifolium]